MVTVSAQSTRTAGAVARYAQKDPVAVSAVNVPAPLFEHELATIRARHGKGGVRPKVITDDDGTVIRDEAGNGIIATDSQGNTVYEAKFVQAYSLVQSFGHDDLDPDDPQSWTAAQQLGRALAEDRFPGHPALIATEVNGRSGCVHNHMIVGAVHPATGKSIDSNLVSHTRLAIEHDRVLAEHGLQQRDDLRAIAADARQRRDRVRRAVQARLPSGLSATQRRRTLTAAENTVTFTGGTAGSASQQREQRRLREYERYLLREQTRHAAMEADLPPPRERFSEIVLESRISTAIADPRSRSWDALDVVSRRHGVTIRRHGDDVSYGMMLRQSDGSLSAPSRAHTRRGGRPGTTTGLGYGFRRADIEAALARNAEDSPRRQGNDATNTRKEEQEMARPKIDDREVRKIRTAMSQDGRQKAAARFDESSPEFQKASRDRQRKLTHAGNAQRRLHTTDQNKEEPTMAQHNGTKKAQSPAAQRSQQTQRTQAQERIAQRRKKQAQQNARLAERSPSQGQGM